MRIQRDQIIATALVLLDEHGLDGLTLRALAQALDIQAPSLYWHFPNKKALIDGMADALLEGVGHTPTDGMPWEEALRTVCGELRRAMLSHRDGARVYTGTYLVTENAMRMGEAMLAPLVRAGADRQLAAWGIFSLMYYVMGFAIEEQALRPENGIDVSALKARLPALTEARFPEVFRSADAMFDNDVDARYVFGLDLMIAGLAGKIKAAKKGASK